MVKCIIGPLVFTDGFYFEKNNDYGVMDGKEKFTIRGETWKINQLRGLVTPGKTETSMGLTIRSAQQKNWGPVWINGADTPGDEYDNVRLNHKGWYLIREVDIDYVNSRRAQAVLTVELIDNAYDVFMEMDYTDNYLAGTGLNHTYDLTNEVVLFEDNFNGSTLDGTKWSATLWNITGGSHTVSGGKLHMSGYQTTYRKGYPNWGARSIQSKQTFDAPFYAEFDLEVPESSSGSGTVVRGHNLHFVLRPGQWFDYEGWPDTFLIVNDTGDGKRDRRFVRPGVDPLVQEYTTLGDTLHKWKILVESNGLLTAWKWNSSTSQWDFFWKGPTGLSRVKGLTLGFTYHSHESINHTVKVDNIKVYRNKEQVLQSIAKVPKTGRTYMVGRIARGDAYALSGDGGDPLFQPHPTDLTSIYRGSPKAYSSYNPTNTERQIFNPNEILKPSKCYFENNLLKLVPLTDSVEVYHNLGGTWALLTTLSLGETVSYIKMLNCTPEELTLQINRTKWKLRRGEPFIYVEHPYNDLGFPYWNSYVSDGVRRSGAAGLEIPMMSSHYALAYSPHNMLTLNQFNVETNADGWGGQGASVTWQSSGGYPSGACLKIDTNNAGVGEGLAQTLYTDIPTSPVVGSSFCAFAYLKGAVGGETVDFQVWGRDSDGVAIPQDTITGSIKTLSRDYAKYTTNITITDPNTSKISMKIVSDVKQDITFFADYMGIVPSPTNTVEGSGWVDPARRYAMLLMKTDPTTIYSDLIPASNMTGIGVYDQLERQNSYNYFERIAYEWLSPVDQRIRIVK